MSQTHCNGTAVHLNGSVNADTLTVRATTPPSLRDVHFGMPLPADAVVCRCPAPTAPHGRGLTVHLGRPHGTAPTPGGSKLRCTPQHKAERGSAGHSGQPPHPPQKLLPSAQKFHVTYWTSSHGETQCGGHESRTRRPLRAMTRPSSPNRRGALCRRKQERRSARWGVGTGGAQASGA